MAWYPERKKRRGLVVVGAHCTRLNGETGGTLTESEIQAAVDDGKLYPAGHAVTLARFRAARERQKAEGGRQKAENFAAAVHQDSLKPYNCPALGCDIHSVSQRKRVMREHYEKTGVRLRDFV